MAKRGNPNMQKGAPSVNPTGVKKSGQAPGATNVQAYGGFLSLVGEPPQLTGRRKWIEYANAPIRSAPVAISMLLRGALFAGAKWTLTENEAGGRNARKGVDIIQRGLLDAKMPTPWPMVVRKAALAYHYGFTMQAAGIARRPDGLVTFTEIEGRPQHTILRWLRKDQRDSRTPFSAVEQRLDTGETFTLPLDECFYLRSDCVGGESPEGVGVLRLIHERTHRTQSFRALEATEMFSSMGGIPIARAPLEDIVANITDETEAANAVTNATLAIETVVANRIKTPEKQPYLKLDSRTYQGQDPNTISPVQKWGIEIVKGDLQGLDQIRKVINDNDLDDARILGVEFVLVGGGDTRGSFGMHESKVSLFSAQLSADLDALGVQATQQLCRRLIAANGLDPDTATPTLAAAPIGTEDVLKTAQTLVAWRAAGLPPNHPASVTLFDRLNLPWQEEPEPVLPRAMPPAPAPAGDKNPDDAPDRTEPTPEDIAAKEPAT